MEIIRGKRVNIVQTYNEKEMCSMGTVRSKIQKEVDSKGNEHDAVVGYVTSTPRKTSLTVYDQYKNESYIYEEFEEKKEELIKNAKWWENYMNRR